jgi:TonB family protein
VGEGPVRFGVPNGSLSVDGAASDMAMTYFAVALHLVEQNFHPPYTKAGVYCRVKFTILKDGTITNPEIVQSTNSPSLDRFAVQALQKTAKLPALYDGFRQNFLEVTFTFNYEKRS